MPIDLIPVEVCASAWCEASVQKSVGALQSDQHRIALLAPDSYRLARCMMRVGAVDTTACADSVMTALVWAVQL